METLPAVNQCRNSRVTSDPMVLRYSGYADVTEQYQKIEKKGERLLEKEL
jgi:hypothetical protein